MTVPRVGDLLPSQSTVINPAYVEAFTYRANVTLLTPGQVTDQAQVRALFRELEMLPLTDYEPVEVRRQFPLNQQLANSCGPTAMSGIAFLMAIHHMTDFVGMLDALVAMGADRSHVTILDKGYPYTDRRRVDGWLRTTLGMNVGCYHDWERIIGEHITRAEATGLKTMIFDDGGHCWPVISERYPDKMRDFIGIVEQTISGIWKIEGHPLPVPTFSLRWLGGPLSETDKRLLVEQKLAGLLALRSRARAGRLPETEAGRRLAEWLTNRYLFIRMVYQHIDLFLGLLADEASGS